MLKKAQAVILLICSAIFVLSIIIESFIPKENTSLTPQQSWSNYKVNVEYPSCAFANNIRVYLIINGSANESIDLYNLGPALKVTIMQNQTTLCEETRYALDFDENGETKVDISFSYAQPSFEENVNFTVIAKIGTETAERRLLYYTFEDSFNMSTLHALIRPVVSIVSLIIGIVDGIVFIVKRN